MIIKINHADERAIYVQIMDEIKRSLVVGSLRPDEPLPSVRQLASDIKVNPNTVKQAYRELEHEGRVYALRGRGTFAAHTSMIPPDKDRRSLVRGVAERAVRDAYRHGLTPTELIAAIGEAAGDRLKGEGVA